MTAKNGSISLKNVMFEMLHELTCNYKIPIDLHVMDRRKQSIIRVNKLRLNLVL